MKIWYVILFLLSACGTQSSLIKDGDVYLYQGKTQIIIGFTTPTQSDEILDTTAEMITFLQKKSPKTEESFLIEGLTDDTFFNFYAIADSLFFGNDLYQNKTLIYGYVSSLYVEFSQKHLNKNSFIALGEFDNFIKDHSLSQKETEILLQSAVAFAIDDIFYISTLELLERPQRYFYPQKTKEELFRVSIYPELVSYWNYLQFRFGQNLLLKTAQKPYDAQEWQAIFGEDIGTVEASFVSSVKGSHQKSAILSTESNYTTFTNSLKLYLSGTKKSLMVE